MTPHTMPPLSGSFMDWKILRFGQFEGGTGLVLRNVCHSGLLRFLWGSRHGARAATFCCHNGDSSARRRQRAASGVPEGGAYGLEISDRGVGPGPVSCPTASVCGLSDVLSPNGGIVPVVPFPGHARSDPVWTRFSTKRPTGKQSHERASAAMGTKKTRRPGSPRLRREVTPRPNRRPPP